MHLPDLKRDFIKYVSFNIIGLVGISLYILADTYFVSKGLGTDGLAALNLVLPVFNFLNGFGLMFGIGGSTVFSVNYGYADRAENDRIFMNAVLGIGRIALISEMIALFFSKPLAGLLGADSSIFDLAHDYLRLVLFFSPAFLLNQMLNCFVRNDGAPRLATAAMIVSSAVNVLLDYDFIFIQEMGMKGAALATCLSPLFSIAVMSIHLLNGWNSFSFCKINQPSELLIKKMIELGVPTLVTELAAGMVMIVFNFLILNIEGNTGVAAYGIVANIAIVVVSLYTGISYGIQPLMSKAHGAEDKPALRYLLNASLRLAMLISVIVYFMMFFHSMEISEIFNSDHDEQLQRMAETGIRIYFLAIPFMGINIIHSVLFTSLEKPKPAQLISLLRGIVLVVILARIFSGLWGITGIWLAIPAAELLTCITGIIIYMIQFRTEIIDKPIDPLAAYYD